MNIWQKNNKKFIFFLKTASDFGGSRVYMIERIERGKFHEEKNSIVFVGDDSLCVRNVLPRIRDESGR